VSTGGRSPAAAAWVRDRLAEEIGPDYGTLVAILAEERDRLRAAGVSSESLDWRGALESGMLEDIGNGRVTEAKERLRACLSSSSD
jgi:siroheme synthase (precorrin-2 oxidase/ferrochelatase)